MTTSISEILESEQPERLGTGFVFTEGPVWHTDGSLYFVDIRRSLLLRWSRSGGVDVVREETGEGNGTTFDRQGRMVMCEGANRRVTRQEADGRWGVLADGWQGKRLNRPNDVVCRSDGSVYFTDPNGRVPPEQRELDVSGVFRVAPDGGLSLATGECEYPNGLAFSPDERVLYVAISRRDQGCFEEEERGEVCHHRYIRAFDVHRGRDAEQRAGVRQHGVGGGRGARRHEGGLAGPRVLHRPRGVLGLWARWGAAGDHPPTGDPGQLRLWRGGPPDAVPDGANVRVRGPGAAAGHLGALTAPGGSGTGEGGGLELGRLSAQGGMMRSGSSRDTLRLRTRTAAVGIVMAAAIVFAGAICLDEGRTDVPDATVGSAVGGDTDASEARGGDDDSRGDSGGDDDGDDDRDGESDDGPTTKLG